MLNSEILKNKKVIEDGDKEIITDMIYSTFKFPDENIGGGTIRVLEEEKMRPDLVSNRVLGEQGKWDALLKYNAVSNPFSLNENDILYMIPASNISSMYIKPRDIQERGSKSEQQFNPIIDPKTQKDKSRLSNLSNKNQLPPNINSETDTNVKVKDGKIVFGEDVTTVNKNNCPVPISRSRLQASLLKDKLFI